MLIAITLSAMLFTASSEELMHRAKAIGMGANVMERAVGKRTPEELRKTGVRFLSDLQRLRGKVAGCEETLAKIEIVENEIKAENFRIKESGEALAQSIQECAKQRK